MEKIINRLAGEPVALRAALAAVLNLLVVTHVIDTGLSDAIEQGIAALASVVLIADARAKVTPNHRVSARTLDSYIMGVRRGSKLGQTDQ